MERLSTDFLEHASVCSSQYDEMCRTMAAEILDLRRLVGFARLEYGAFQTLSGETLIKMDAAGGKFANDPMAHK